MATAATRLTVPSGCTFPGSDGMKLTEGVVFAAMVIGLDAMLTLESATEVAWTTTDVPGGVGGAVYIAVAPLAVCDGYT